MKTLPVGSVYMIVCRYHAAYYLFMNIVPLKTYSLNTNATGCNRNLDSRNTLQIKKVQWAYSQKTLYITFLVKISNFFSNWSGKGKLYYTHTNTTCLFYARSENDAGNSTDTLIRNSFCCYLPYCKYKQFPYF